MKVSKSRQVIYKRSRIPSKQRGVLDSSAHEKALHPPEPNRTSSPSDSSSTPTKKTGAVWTGSYLNKWGIHDLPLKLAELFPFFLEHGSCKVVDRIRLLWVQIVHGVLHTRTHPKDPSKTLGKVADQPDLLPDPQYSILTRVFFRQFTSQGRLNRRQSHLRQRAGICIVHIPTLMRSMGGNTL